MDAEEEHPAGEEPVADEQPEVEEAEGAEGAEGENAGEEGEGAGEAGAGDEENKEAAEEVVDYSKDERVMYMCNALTSLDEFSMEKLDQAKYRQFHDFLENPTYNKFFVWLEHANNYTLRTSFDGAPAFFDAGIKAEEYQVCFYLKRSGNDPIVPALLESQLLVGQIDGNPLDDLLNKMNAEYVPKLLGENDWPDGVRKEFQANLNKFMATITEESQLAKGRTYLYIPEETITDVDTAVKDKDLLQRLESTVIYWTRQIKELVSNQDAQASMENSSPLDEIKHWNDRNGNLKLLTTRLKEPKLKKITEVLEHANSSYLQGFKELEEKIALGHAEANDNLTFLSLLAEPCRKMESALPRDIPKMLPEVLNSVRVIWELSKFYSTPERMKGLLTKISNQIIRRCHAQINKDDLLGRNVDKCIADLDECIDCCKQWKDICTRSQRMIQKYSSRKGYTVSEDEIFAENEAFIQRCKDLKEICEGQLQFAQAGSNKTLPVFGGTKGAEWTSSLMDLKNMFVQYLDKIKQLDYDILDVKITAWHDNYGQEFKENVKSIEVIYTTIIQLTFKHVSTIEDAVEMLENFYQMARRPSIQDHVKKKAADLVYKLFLDEMKEVEDLFDKWPKPQSAPPMPYSHPQYAGIAIWMYSLIKRIDKAKFAIDGLYFIPEHKDHKEAMDRYHKLKNQLDQSITKSHFNDWQESMGQTKTQEVIDDCMAKSILVRCELTSGTQMDEQGGEDEGRKPARGEEAQRKTRKRTMLESNFDVKLLQVQLEMQYWQKVSTLGLNFPLVLVKLLQRKDQLRVLRENVMLIVRDYNNIMQLINKREANLFSNQLDILDAVINGGIKRYNWMSSADQFVIQSRNECQNTYDKIDQFKTSYSRITDEFERISSCVLTKIQKHLYSLEGFMEAQQKELKSKQVFFKDSFETIRSEFMHIYNEYFYHGKQNIQVFWLDFMRELDKDMERALKSSVKNSLLDLQKHIKGDQQEIMPIFKIFTVISNTPMLDGDQDWQVVNEPSHSTLRQSIVEFIQYIIHTTSVVPRIEAVFRKNHEILVNKYWKMELDLMRNSGGGAVRGADANYQNLTEEEKEERYRKEKSLPEPDRKRRFDYPYVDNVSQSREINQLSTHITEIVENIRHNMEAECRSWQNAPEVKQIMSMGTQRGKTRFLKQSNQNNADKVDKNPQLMYKSVIESVGEHIDDVRNKQATRNEQFIILDSSKLKTRLIDGGQEYIHYILNQLVTDSKNELNKLLTHMVETVDELRQHSAKLEQLKTNRERLAQVRGEQTMLEAQLEPIKKKFAFIMDDGNNSNGTIELTDEDKAKLAGLDDAWAKYIKGLAEAQGIINKNYAELKAEMENTIDDFKKEVQENRQDFKQNAPTAVDKNDEFNNQKALEKLDDFKVKCADLRSKEEEHKFGLDIFEQEPADYTELSQVEKENALLADIWHVKEEWDSQWNQWKHITFYKLDVANMEEEAYDYKRKLLGMNKEVKQWQVFEYLKAKVQLFIDTMGLLPDLLHESIRERHWNDIRFEVKEEFNQHSEEFNLEKVFELELHKHANMIGELADHARKQLKIENSLNEIKSMWEDDPATNLEIIKERSRADNEEYYKITSTENIFAVIEEHTQALSQHKSSPYYKQFDEKIDLWDTNIANITETLEMLIQVQSKWMYLESIFKGQPDLARQLPGESSTFAKIDQQFKQEMTRVAKERNCYRALIGNGQTFLKFLSEQNYKLEGIQKQLQQFLQAKRGNFPRFYFLSDDDLLEIIGQAKDPTPINKHIKKIFEGVNSLESQHEGKGGSKQYVITKVLSIEKEEIELGNRSVPVDQKVETWLEKLRTNIQQTLRKLFQKFWTDQLPTIQKKVPAKDMMGKIIHGSKGQILIAMTQIEWTTQVTNALQQMGAGSLDANPLKKVRNLYKKKTELLIECVEKHNLPMVDRIKIIALIIIEEHNREVIEKLNANKSVTDEKHFEWQSQLRFARRSEEPDQQSDEMIIDIFQLNAGFEYGCEYQGNNGRLVVTPLTDRAYMTLTNALNLFRGGAPQGPAGTGKTETVKDLGKNLAFFVVIQNCSDQMDHIAMANIFSGLAMSGSWGCFDEFNRILLDVLSVIASQIQVILDAVKRGHKSACNLNEKIIEVDKNTGLFITMNPGYAGRSELPDNLAALFRPVAMMVPDFNAIAKVELMSEGFKQNEVLAKKVYTIYELMRNQLSKADHYDFGMRAIKSVLKSSGRIKRECPQLDEQTVLIKSIRDMNLPKFIAEDVILFDNMFVDLFPECEEPEVDTDALQLAIEDCLIQRNMQLNENLIVKTMQLYESKRTRHGNMLVGQTQSGKTSAWQILQETLNLLHKEEKEKFNKGEDAEYNYRPVHTEIVNPKAIDLNELYGFFDDGSPPQWRQGILSEVLKNMVTEKQDKSRWIVLDGPVDTLWIETMNSVLDDSKLLTLQNGDRIALTPNVRLLFEVENLKQASLATVSRAGMIYMDLDELGWKPYFEQWIAGKTEKFGQEYGERLTEFTNKWLEKVLTIKKTHCKELVKTSETSCCRSMTKLFDAMTGNLQKHETEESMDDFMAYVEKYFVFAMIWSVGATVDEFSRREIDNVMRDTDAQFPNSDTVYEYYINPQKKNWDEWSGRIAQSLKATGKQFHEIMVDTVDTVRNRTVVQQLLDHNDQVLLVGHSGVGKTVLVEGILKGLDPLFNSFVINFSAGSTSEGLQAMIESQYDRRAKNKFKPKNSKVKAICFIDDLNMPRPDTYGFQPPLELIRMHLDYAFWYSRTSTQLAKHFICDLQILSSMGKPGGGRSEISSRLLSQFHVINYTIPSEVNMKRIFQTIVEMKLGTFYEEIRTQCEPLALATIALYNQLSDNFKPTPAKSHYVFNMRDISKVFQGMYQIEKDSYESKEQIIRLWCHEALRVFYDRLIDSSDQTLFKTLLDEQLGLHFQMSYMTDCTHNEKDTVFVDFLFDPEGERKVYEEVTDFGQLSEKLNGALDLYNQLPKITKMNIVLFVDAIIHVTKIIRILNLKRGHAMLVGVGGSGRHSLSRLSAYMSTMMCDQLEIRKDFGLKDFRTKLREMYERVGFRDKEQRPMCFLFADNDVVQETFLEDVQNMLNSGIVPNIYTADELSNLRTEMTKMYKISGNTNEAPDAMNEWFFNRIKDNVHMSILMSPVGETFRSFCRQYPALINNTTIDWFMAWPYEALIEVANKFLGALELPDDKRAGLAALAAFTHSTTYASSIKMFNELKRMFYVTPTNFIELLKGYSKILGQKRKVIGTQIDKLRNGLSKLEEAREEVKVMTAESEIKRQEVTKKTSECEALLHDVQRETKDANEKSVIIEAEKKKIEAETITANALAASAQIELQKAMPALGAAQDAVNQLDKKYIAEIKAFTSPPKDVAIVMGAVMTFLRKPTDWMSVKKELTDPKFVDKIMDFDKENISPNTLKAIEKYTKEENFRPEYVGGKSFAAGCLCAWVCAIEDYAKCLKIVNPKREAMAKAQAIVAKLEENMQGLLNEYEGVLKKLEYLNKLADEQNREVEKLKNDLQQLQSKIDRGDKLVSGLADEKVRWEASLVDLDMNFTNLVGDCALSAAFMSYCAPFPSEYRNELFASWIDRIVEDSIPYSKTYDFAEFLAGKALARQWQQDGLPTDDFSTENGVFVTRGLRWALNIDPQTQANKWIKRMVGDQLYIADFKDTGYMRKIEKCIQDGKTLLLQDVGETMDPTLDNLLNKSLVQVGKRFSVKLGEKEIDYNTKFQLYITTRMSNPHYTPEISTKVTVVNFTVVEKGLEEQCLGLVIKSEQPSLETQKNEKLTTISNGKAQIMELEDKILMRLVESEVNLLEDETLVGTLQLSKEVSDTVKADIDSAENILRRINDQREVYRACGRKASVLFFVLADLCKIDPMYQFSLDWYLNLFEASISESKEQVSQDRQDMIMKVHKLNVYNNACRSLFERHKLLLALQMLVRLLMSEDKIAREEYDFFLRGGTVLDAKDQMLKPQQDWITKDAWDNITELERLLPETFAGLPAAINLNPKEWQHWFSSDKPEPELAQLPGEWETKCEDQLKKMIVLRCFRPDRVNFAIRNFVAAGMKSNEFITSKPTSIQEVFDESAPELPIVFVLSTGVDPTEVLTRFADEKGCKVNTLSLGKGQSKKALELLNKSATNGEWTFLSNCHLSISLLPELESMMDQLFKQKLDRNFRLFLSASPHPEFPISLLQRSLKIAQEPPRGIKANMLRLYANQGKGFTLVDKERDFRKAVFGLSWFHSILIERKKFKTLGWNVSYAFNDSDYSVCEDTIANYLGRLTDGGFVGDYKKTDKINWQAIQYLIAEANYGGRITDERDRRLIKVYSREIFEEILTAIEKWRPQGTEEFNYVYPADEAGTKHPNVAEIFSPAFFIEEIAKQMTGQDPPIAFGQHTNAEITSQIMDSNELLAAILSLQPAVASGGSGGAGNAVLELIGKLREGTPEMISVPAVKQRLNKLNKQEKDSPLNVVLVQEIQRYNILLSVMVISLEQLEKGIKGEVVISPDLEVMMISLSQNIVPVKWSFAYLSLKNLANWFVDLNERYKFFENWSNKVTMPPCVHWISAYTYPTGFTTGILQKFARKDDKSPPIDKLDFDFQPTPRPVNDITEQPKDGAYITGLYLEGAKWNNDKQWLMEPEVMELFCAMPVIWFRPIPKRTKPLQNYYECPTYYYPSRQAIGARESFMIKIDLKCGEQPSEFWIKRGTALLMSLA